METNPRLGKLILEVVDNQLNANDPPETRQTLDRLMREGQPRSEAKRLIACIVANDMVEIMKEGKPFDHDRFVAALNRLPKLPWEE